MTLVSIDDYPLSRQGLMAILNLEEEFEFIGQASCIDEARDIISRLNPEIIFLDLKLKDECGFDLISDVKNLNPNCKVIILTSSLDPGDFKRASEFGVDGYIIKDAMPEEIVNAVRLVSKGRKYYDPSIMEILMKQEKLNNMEQLTTRELDVLAMLGKGLNNKEIGKGLFITEYTVKKHISQIFGKLGLSCRTQAALYANKHGIVH
ncbi:response regulator containing a CheY-like receiver domain and an HTH DNA-binding domain [Desulfosporosinus orientis DSM 765]|uniref:Stage 0 sporulation protein A homolog n=1 Tax=Desulfosporosinus orientis (strain ATCC 19365 / DSM 765 / NCIMB 8382 / VKM B-1628 / Singapore I) TaxID=768706 RepID=G7WJS7_DESOD|nr:response regulator transcription factor [Desulfosporosinus orientis]AET70514.1 response regulator containing a CheY-like receiver domain and an HTH DNA-binding domain [Desulfosporosinus orientis DSM 765]